MNELNELLSYFEGRCLPETEFVISPWARTSNLLKCVKLAIATAQDGNKASIRRLQMIRQRLERQQVVRAKW
ncbi:hypothetical protein GO730_00185 [Spirosoma sp. HMF3257]|uniref:DUF6965 domain-containing protein n=1 Tax=Spirosoma telluris TaxID=2183553 RepID=A0A327NGZ8_9BACT|nr:hypothetical protein [Spirosoma telluris]RAI73226.1 hypothetical protein HMF3257_00185 [Spirosoma telluris]